jgi:UDP-N-acetylmuramoyl-tripeptide--D-alanyl-D-alanine ligase
MVAALDVLSRSEPAAGGRRVVVFGDMLELGTEGPALHASLAKNIEDARIDLVFLAGPVMRALWDVLPPSYRGAYAETSIALAPQVVNAVRAGDVVLVKASNGIRISQIVEALGGSDQKGEAA